MKFEKGNVPLTEYKSESPIAQEKINPLIWQKIQAESGVENLGDTNEIEFLIMKDLASGKYTANFIKITRADGDTVEVRASDELCTLIVNFREDQSGNNKI